MSAFIPYIKHGAQALLNMLFPPRCLLCQAFIPAVGALCSDCWQHIDFTSYPSCAICSHPFEYDMGEKTLCAVCIATPPPYRKAYSVFKYNEHSKKLIHRFKYNDQIHAAPHFAAWLARAAADALKEADMLVPVPLHRYRLWKRRYNQSALLANALGKITQVPVGLELLLRTKHTVPQAGLTNVQRQKNVQGVFKLNPRYDSIKGKHIILIDDVMTTGATLIACSKILRKAGAQVTVVTLARTVIE
jgi:ComF family protein